MSEGPDQRGFLKIFLVFLKLGLTSFGGPVAHLGYFRDELVHRKKWLGDRAYAELVALCQFLPGPASSQVGIGIGMSAGGVPGALAAWLGFTLPSALVMAAAGLWVGASVEPGWTSDLLGGFRLVAVAVVANAVLGMAKSLCPDRTTRTIAAAGVAVAILLPGVVGQLAAIVLGALAGRWWCTEGGAGQPGGGGSGFGWALGRRGAVVALVLFFGLLVGLPVLARLTGGGAAALADPFYRVGSLVFGGGHVVLPLLRAEVVPNLVSEEAFVGGYGIAQAVPGPLFTFSAFLGGAGGGGAGALVCLLAIFLPSFLLLGGILPFWGRLVSRPAVARAVTGVNAAVVGLLAAALYDPVFTTGVGSAPDFACALLLFVALSTWKVPPWAIVAVGGVLGVVLGGV